tara:strand:- start:11054 stop:11434 length:381 start_codon:yes stop_codon:yes gene_type:complete
MPKIPKVPVEVEVKELKEDPDFVPTQEELDEASVSSDEPEPEPEIYEGETKINRNPRPLLTPEDELMKTLLNLGELKVDNINEIQFILKAVYDSPMSEITKKQCGLCMNMLLTLSNNFLQDYSKKL